MKKFLYPLLLAFLILSFTSCNQKDSNENQIVILHTNDMHASIENMDKLAAYKEKIEKQYEDVFLVDAGDIFSGNPIVDFYEKKGYPIINLMNNIGYDISHWKS
ncbi:MAG: hypothetical protein R6U04_04010 [Bacteroidales bacterium]